MRTKLRGTKPKRVWVNVSVADKATKHRYEKAARKAKQPLARWARSVLDREADVLLGPPMFRDVA